MAPNFSNTWQLFDRHGCRKYLSKDEVWRFLKAADKASPAIRALAYTLTYTGCRLSEALALETHHLDPDEKVLIFKTLKRRGIHFRAVPIPDELLGMLVALSSTQTPSLKYWTCHRVTAWRQMKALFRAAGIVGIHASPKGLRHRFALSAAEAKVPAHLIQRWMGHARLETTAIYQNAFGVEERGFAERVWG